MHCKYKGIYRSMKEFPKCQQGVQSGGQTSGADGLEKVGLKTKQGTELEVADKDVEVLFGNNEDGEDQE